MWLASIILDPVTVLEAEQEAPSKTPTAVVI